MGELATLADEIVLRYLDSSCLEPVSSHILVAGKIKKPLQICINERNIASTGDMNTPAVQDLIGSCEELDLSSNNLQLTSVPEILEHFPVLKVLNLCRNPLHEIKMMDKGFVASRLEVLVLNNCLLSSEGLFWLLQICPELKRLHLDSTSIDFGKADQDLSFQNIEVLHFSKNRLSPLELNYLSSFFPNVKELYFMQNQSEELWQTIDESMFTKLEKLSLNDCLICEWGEIESFGCLKSLKHLKLFNCPILQGLDVNLRRQLVIARLPHLITLNGGETITRDARDKAERAFIRYYMEQENKPESLATIVSHRIYETYMNCYMLMKSVLSMCLMSNFVLEPVSGFGRLFALNVKETVPQKRSAFLLDRLVMAVGRGPRYRKGISEYELPISLKKTLLQNYGQENQKNDDFILGKSSGIGVRHTNSRMLRCYFNAVSCF